MIGWLTPLISLLLVLALSAGVQSQVIGNKIVTAKKVIRGLYPELRGRSLQVIVQDKSSLDYLEGTPGIFALWIFEPVNAIAETVKQCPAFLLEPINSKAPITNKCPPFLLSTSFTFTR